MKGDYLNHCVYSYLSDCERKHTHIFSYHRKERLKSILVLAILLVVLVLASLSIAIRV